MDAIFGIFATPLGLLLNFIYNVVSNYGLTIVLFTIVVRICLFPLYFHQQKSTLKTSKLAPKVKQIQQKFATDKQEQQKRIMEMYKEEGVNPMMGCLPLLIQMPILMGLFSLLRNPQTYIDNATTIMATHQNLFWINDLGQPDPWIFPIVAGITTFLTFSISQMSTQTMPGQENQMNSMTKIMKYVFPLLIFWMAKSFPAGLALYWITGNFITMIQSKYFQVWKKKKLKEEKKKK